MAFPKPVFMLKPSHIDNHPAINRKISIIVEDDNRFRVLVRDKDYQDDPSGPADTVVFSGEYKTVAEASIEMEHQVDLSLKEGLIHNIMGML